jgi:hypothetical protein
MAMKISFLPVRMETRLEVSVRGEVLVLNGEELDLSGATERAPLTPEGNPWVVGEVCRTDKALDLVLLLPHGPDAPEETRFPKPLQVVADGPLELPPYDRVVIEPEPEI